MEKIKTIKPGSTHIFEVQDHQEGQRMDAFIASKFSSYSRNFFGKLINMNLVTLNNKSMIKKSTPLKKNDIITLKFPETKKRNPEFIKKIENLDIKIIYENKHFAILNKPDNLMVHPPHPQSGPVTLVDWILENIDGISHVGIDDRPGIVHRLDKDTTGLIIIPKNNCSHAYFANLFKERKIEKTYLAIVKGHPDKTGEIDLHIARDPYNKTKMTCVTESSMVTKIRSKIRNAKTSYKTIEYFDDFSFVAVKPLTGRTHQIRVHFAKIGHPLLSDPVYGQTSKIIGRQALHAYKLEFEFDKEKISVCQEPPQDFQKAIEYLRKNKS